MPNFVVGDLRVPAAAILAGGVVMLGREARTLSGLLLPVALLLATIWRQRVFDVPSASFALNLLLLMAMVASCQWVVWHVRRIGVLWLAAGVLGILIVGYTVRDLPPPAARALHVIGLSVWLAAMAGAVARFLRRRKPPAPGDATTPQ